MANGRQTSYIESLELAELPGALPVSTFLSQGIEEPKPAYVDAASLVGFTQGLAAQHQTDVLNSLLFAQLAATKKFDRSDFRPWYEFYCSVLEEIGWVLGSKEITKYDAGGSMFTVNDVVLEILAGIATPGQLLAITAAIKALKSLSDADHRLQLWNQTSHTATSGNFQIGSASDAGGNVTIASASLFFETTETVTNVLVFHFTRGITTLYRSAQQMTLDVEVYAKIRDSVATKLGDRAAKYVAGLDLAD